MWEKRHNTELTDKKKQRSQQVLKCHSIMPQAIASFSLDEWVEGKGGRRQCTSTLETAEEDHKEGATEFLTTAAADED